MLNHCFNVRSFILTAALIGGLGLVTSSLLLSFVKPGV